MLDKLKTLQLRLDDTPHLHRIGALFCDTVLLKIDGDEFYLTFSKGRLESIATGPSKKIPYQFGLSTDAEALTLFWRKIPSPGFHDIFAMAKIGRLEFSGDILRLVKNLRFFKEFLALGRSEKL